LTKNSGSSEVAQFDVHRLGGGLVIDCQADLLSQLGSRFAPPVRRSEAPQIAEGLNPVFEIDGEDHVMLTRAAGAVRRGELALAHRSYEITTALEVLISGI
jgi:toxin CcdB